MTHGKQTRVAGVMGQAAYIGAQMLAELRSEAVKGKVLGYGKNDLACHKKESTFGTNATAAYAFHNVTWGNGKRGV